MNKQQKAIADYKSSVRLQSQAPNTYPHVIDDSIRAETLEDGRIRVVSDVDNGRSVECSGHIYDLSA